MSTNLLPRFALFVGLCALAGGAAASSPAPIAAKSGLDRESSKSYIRAFHEAIFLHRNTGMAHQYLAPTLIQHDPEIADGVAGFLNYYQQLLATYPHSSSEIRRITASGDLVTVHVLQRLTPWDRGSVQIHMYRLSPLGIAEHWVVRNPIPASSLNANGLI